MPHQQFTSCIEACNQCAIACGHCAAECLKEPDPKAMARCIALDIDCADACRFAVAAMSRASECSGTICAMCAEICDTCAEECEKHPMDHCRDCAAACRRCADECRRMAQQQPAKQRSAGADAARAH